MAGAQFVLLLMSGLWIPVAVGAGRAGWGTALALLPVVGVAVLAGSLRSAGLPVRWALWGFQCWLFLQALDAVRAGLWWGGALLVLPPLAGALLLRPAAREWFALPLGLRARPSGVSPARMFRVRIGDSGQTSTEYVGLVVVVVAIVGALVATGVGTELGGHIKSGICRAVGGESCGGGDAKTTADGGGGSNAGTAGSPNETDEPTQEEKDYEEAKKLLEQAQKDLDSDKEKAEKAAKELAKILADELGITDALDCITKGDAAACGETLVNVLASLVGGAAGKLAAKYGAPWKWKKAAALIKALKKHGGDVIGGVKGILKNSKKVKAAEKKLAELEKKLPKRRKEPTGVGNPDAPKPLGRGSTGRTEPKNLTEQIAMKEAQSNPAAGKKVPLKKGMTDSRWPGDEGWQKMTQNVNGVEIHYVYNPKTGQVDDYKFK
ncbi:hypothetical protein [Streptomyces sp. TP-A0874]|uniref:hypothetical protein n=1 Tax=Streptomyces sp. TP-A0874 TaxID=549819 RepID=UPI000852AC1C|nr:hypothetical protein [Streptomyces sp. TP-A0874]